MSKMSYLSRLKRRKLILNPYLYLGLSQCVIFLLDPTSTFYIIWFKSVNNYSCEAAHRQTDRQRDIQRWSQYLPNLDDIGKSVGQRPTTKLTWGLDLDPSVLNLLWLSAHQSVWRCPVLTMAPRSGALTNIGKYATVRFSSSSSSSSSVNITVTGWKLRPGTVWPDQTGPSLVIAQTV